LQKPLVDFVYRALYFIMAVTKAYHHMPQVYASLHTPIHITKNGHRLWNIPSPQLPTRRSSQLCQITNELHFYHSQQLPPSPYFVI